MIVLNTAKVIGGIQLGHNIQYGANAVVTKSFWKMEIHWEEYRKINNNTSRDVLADELFIEQIGS